MSKKVEDLKSKYEPAAKHKEDVKKVSKVSLNKTKAFESVEALQAARGDDVEFYERKMRGVSKFYVKEAEEDIDGPVKSYRKFIGKLLPNLSDDSCKVIFEFIRTQKIRS